MAKSGSSGKSASSGQSGSSEKSAFRQKWFIREEQATQHSRDLGRRHRPIESELLHARSDGLSDAQHRPHCQRRHAVHRQLRRAVMHRGPLSFITGQSVLPHGAFEGRHSGRADRHEREARHDRGAAQGSGLRDRAVRQESPRRPEHMLPTNHGFDEFFGNLYHLNAEEEPEMDNYPPERTFRTSRKTFGPRGVIHSWATDKDDKTVDAALGQGRQAEDRGHRAAHEKAHGDLRRRIRRRRQGLHQAPEQSRQTVVRVAEHHAHALFTHTKKKSLGRPGAGSRRTTTR